jgi:hypothetical protein
LETGGSLTSTLKIIVAALFLLSSNVRAQAEEKKQDTIYLFGKKPIQLEPTRNGIKQNKNSGFICELKAKLTGEKFSEWGQTENDARSIVTKKCSGKAGLLLCKRDDATCKQDH